MKRYLLLSLLLWACPKDAPEPKAQAPEPPKKAEVVAQTPEKAALEAAAPEAAPLPVQADFEEAAETEITTSNYKASLDALEKELAE